MGQEPILNDRHDQEYTPMHTGVFTPRTIKLFVLIFWVLLWGGCEWTTQTDEAPSDCIIMNDSMDGSSDQLQDTVWPNHYKSILEQNKDYYNKVLAFDQRILRGESVPADEAFEIFPKTDDELRVLWNGPDNGTEGYDRGFRHDSVCFRYAMENPSIDKICKYYVAYGCADGIIAEQYHDRCYQLWEKYPEETSKALSTLYTQKEAEAILKGFQEEFLEFGE